ncbi:hypothetical protein FGG79_08335 [Bacillus sp. BHET2]|uniref:BsuPI-related putative proteinase inhibitor n=1 Tax=Bacillus sp. BHET2 TaxID=2583818 RepID=UPI00110E4917|nr:BsuPI-related putative proteinase inhibitor [Bacillus sp. BHET2]TMU88103.1 hypothetical protein FGG79_08335 [Bacillus sp. BHET2]
MKALLYLLASTFILFSFPLTTNAEKTPLNFSVTSFPEEEGTGIWLQLYNHSDREKNLTFHTSQIFDFTIKNNLGEVVYQYSEGKSFLQALQNIVLKKGGTKIWKEKWDYTQDGKRVPEGRYTIEAQFMGEDLSGFDHPLRAVTSFTVPKENHSFRHVNIRHVKGRYTVSGKACVSNGSFYYSVEDGHRVLLKEALLKVNKEAPNWSDFSIILPEIKGSTDQMFIHLYERDDGDGKIIHPYVITIP